MIAWEAAAQGFHLAGDQTILECYAGTSTNDAWKADGTLDEKFVIDSWPNITATDNITIRAAAGEGHGGVYGTGFRLLSTGNGDVVNLNEPYCVFQDISLETTRTTRRAVYFNSSGDFSIVERCIFSSPHNYSSAQGVLGFSAVTGLTIRNSLILYTGADATAKYFHTLRNSMTGNVMDGCSFIPLDGSPAPTVISVSTIGNDSQNPWEFFNCVFYASTWRDLASGDITYGATDTNAFAAGIDTTVGTNPVTGIVTTDFENYTNDEYTPASGQNLDGSVNAGLTRAYTDDITTFSTGLVRVAPYEIGAYEIAGAAPGVTFDGPNIIAQSGVQNDPFSFDENGEGTVASRFTGATSFAYAPGSDQPAGITIDPLTGNPEGTPTVSGTFDITIEGSD
jgi:hypothetical protein